MASDATRQGLGSDAGAHVSTGRLPPAATVREWVADAHRRYAGNREGSPSRVYPALAEVPADLFGIAVAATDGTVHRAGDCDHKFAIMSVSKPFVFALLCERLGVETLGARIGVDATGLPFNSLAAIDRDPAGRTNPMVNPGAIATTSLVPGAGAAQRWEFLHRGLSGFAGRELEIDRRVHASALATNSRNRAIAARLAARGVLAAGAEEAVDLYTRQCALLVDAGDLAVMGATLADGGVNPVTGDRLLAAETCHAVLATMLTAGLYEGSGRWLYEVGLPAKSGIGGGIVTVSPGKGGMGTFAPRLDSAGNSVKGTMAARFLSRRLGLDLLLSAPAR